MSYTPPSGNSLLFDWQGASSYAPPPGDALEFGWGGLVAEPVWDQGGQAYRLEASWSEIDGATEYRLRLRDAAQALLEEITTTGLAHAFTGLGAETAYHLELTGLDGATELDTLTLEVVTPIGLPGGVTGLQHTFTTDSLTFTWEAVESAEDYRLTLSRDGDLVEELTTNDLTATFTTLEDGTTYDLAIQAHNAQGGGPIAYYQADTGYLAPQPPTNLRQFEERIIAVICRWDLVDPDKTFDVQLQLLYGDDLLYDEVRDADLEERTFPVPMASTNYLLRVRAGNPGGWSPWAEAWVYTENFPLIDSRLAVLAAGYQEDALYPDTWDGASDQLKGVVESLRTVAEVGVGGYGLEATYRPPVESDPYDEARFAPSISVSVTERPVLQFYEPEDEARFSPAITMSVTEQLVLKLYETKDEARFSPTIALSTAEAIKQYRYRPSDEARFAPSIVIGVTETLV